MKIIKQSLKSSLSSRKLSEYKSEKNIYYQVKISLFFLLEDNFRVYSWVYKDLHLQAMLIHSVG